MHCLEENSGENEEVHQVNEHTELLCRDFFRILLRL